MTDRFNWLHLTDLHLGAPDQASLWTNIRDAFFDDLKALRERAGPWHAVLFTGDLVYSGSETEFRALDAQVMNRLFDVLSSLDSDGAALLAVPGNHDLARPMKSKPSAALRQILRVGGFEEIAAEFWDDLTGEYGEIIASALSNYRQWWKGTPNRKNVLVNDGLVIGDFAATVTVQDRHIGIVGLNTAFLQLAPGHYKGRLAWDPRQLHAVCVDVGDWIAAHDACLLLTHQGDDWLSDTARRAYAEIAPAGRFAVHLFGHMHETDLLRIA